MTPCTIRKIRHTVQKAVDELSQAALDALQLLRSRAVMFSNFVETYLAAGNLGDAAAEAALGFDIDRKLAAQDAGNAQAQTDVVVSLVKIGAVADSPQARAALTEALSIIEQLEKEHRLTGSQKNWPDVLRAALAKLP